VPGMGEHRIILDLYVPAFNHIVLQAVRRHARFRVKGSHWRCSFNRRPGSSGMWQSGNSSSPCVLSDVRGISGHWHYRFDVYGAHGVFGGAEALVRIHYFVPLDPVARIG
jgi:hypothetical protein